jgi:putative sugar O-methyltransferase
MENILNRMKKRILILILVFTCPFLLADKSITGGDVVYRSACRKAASDTVYFQQFRSISDYTHALELNGGVEFAIYLLKNASPETMQKLEAFSQLETLGSPSLRFFPGVGTFSGTTLRYIVIADQIQKFFRLPDNACIAEIGAGFGGQCYILSQLQSFSNYYIYDLPEAEALIDRVTQALFVPNVTCLPVNSLLPQEKVDLVISNYAFSECDRAMQMDYFERVIKRSDRGYMIYNQISRRVFGIDSLSPQEFVEMLEKEGLYPRIIPEPVSTDVDNLLIIWERRSH